MALIAIGAERLTVDDTAGGVAFTTTELDSGRVVRAYCTVETAEIRIQTASGVTVTAGGTEGSPALQPGKAFYIYGGEDLVNFRAIRTGATSGVLNVIFEGVGA